MHFQGFEHYRKNKTKKKQLPRNQYKRKYVERIIKVLNTSCSTWHLLLSTFIHSLFFANISCGLFHSQHTILRAKYGGALLRRYQRRPSQTKQQLVVRFSGILSFNEISPFRVRNFMPGNDRSSTRLAILKHGEKGSAYFFLKAICFCIDDRKVK